MKDKTHSKPDEEDTLSVRNVVDKSGGRKFFMVLACAFICTGLLVYAYIPPEIFRDLIIATVSVYLGSNVYQKVGEMKYNRYGGGSE